MIDSVLVNGTASIPVTRKTAARMEQELHNIKEKITDQRNKLHDYGTRHAEQMDVQTAQNMKGDIAVLENNKKYIDALLNSGQLTYIDDMKIDTSVVGMGTAVKLLDIGEKKIIVIIFLGPLDINNEDIFHNPFEDEPFYVCDFDPQEVPTAMAIEGQSVGYRFTSKGIEYEILEIKRWDD